MGPGSVGVQVAVGFGLGPGLDWAGDRPAPDSGPAVASAAAARSALSSVPAAPAHTAAAATMAMASRSPCSMRP
ncbi:MAG: hypothetical protein U0470_13270 [Anaerolineae bacterium]